MTSQGPGSPGFGRVELVGKLGGAAHVEEPPRSGVLITGGSGFLGHALVEKLIADGCPRICILSRNEFTQARMRAHFQDDPRIRFFIGDVRDRDRLVWAMESVQAVIHAAALKRIEVGAYNPIEMVRTNIDGSINVIEAARRARVGKVLLVSSDKAYAPISPYGFSKAMAESLFLNSNVTGQTPLFAAVRYGNVAGSTGSVIPTWRAAIAKDEVVKITTPACTRFWMTREEAAKFVVDSLVEIDRQAASGEAWGGQLFVPDLPAFSVGDLYTAMGGKQYEIVGLPEHEKEHESMDRERYSATARRMSVDELRERLKGVA